VSNLVKGIRMLFFNQKGLILALNQYGIYNWMPDKMFLKMMYKLSTGRKLNIEEPRTFNEKLNWLKLNDRKPEYVQQVDKFGVRKYIADTVGEEYLIPLMGVYDSFEEIDFNVLPDQFVLKCTHDSKSLLICEDKANFDYESAKKKLTRSLKRNLFWHGREWSYKDVKPRIICEEFISENGKAPDDYKVMCFNGKAKLIQVHLDRFSGNHVVDFYDIKWENTGITLYLPNSKTAIPKPSIFEQMISLSEILAKDKYYVRIDWYIVGNKLYFGEITFFDGSGFMSFDKFDDDVMVGGWIKLPADK
jgi:hypothetical protein